jgi:Terpene cyclase DEP1
VKVRHFYLALALLGLLLPYWQLIPWLVAHGPNLALLFRELFANRVAAAFGIDVLLSAIVFLAFVLGEGRRLQIRGLWLPLVLSSSLACPSPCLYFFTCASASWSAAARFEKQFASAPLQMRAPEHGTSFVSPG